MEIIASILFIIVVVMMIRVVHSISMDMGGGWTPSILVVTWLAITGAMSYRGFFAEFSGMPPNFALLISVPTVIIILLAISKGVGKRLENISPDKLVRYQSMRIAVEICLFLLALDAVIPKLMTPEGRNFDVVIGLTAFFAARWVMDPKKRGLAIGWNVLGILLLVNVVTHGMLAAPTDFQVFDTTPPNSFIAHLPWVWLPGFVVPIALFGHVMSLKQLMRNR